MSDVIYNISSGFFDSVNGDRLYSAGDMNKPYKRVIADGIFPTPQGTPSTDFQVVAVSGMSVAVLAGNAMIGARWAENTDDVGITIAGNSSSSPRIDSIFLHIDTGMDTRAAGVVYRQGTAAGTPTAPAMVQTDNITELRLADILVAPSAAIITQANITDQRGGSDCPWVAGLIQQVDTSALFDQYRAAYAEQQQDQANEWNTFMDHLARDYDISMSLRKHESTYTSTAAASLIPINIDGYDTTKDLLQVYINGIFAVEGTHYIVKSATQIQLTNAISAGQKVHFVIYKAVMGGAQPIIPTDEQVQDAVDAYMDAHPGALVVDPELSDTSTHAIQNKAVAEALAGVNGRLDEYDDVFTGDVDESVQAWLDEHPEATTTVQDGSLTYAKLVTGTLGYVSYEMFGAVLDGVTDDSTAVANTHAYANAHGLPIIQKGGSLLVNFHNIPVKTDCELDIDFIITNATQDDAYVVQHDSTADVTATLNISAGDSVVTSAAFKGRFCVPYKESDVLSLGKRNSGTEAHNVQFWHHQPLAADFNGNILTMYPWMDINENNVQLRGYSRIDEKGATIKGGNIIVNKTNAYGFPTLFRISRNNTKVVDFTVECPSVINAATSSGGLFAVHNCCNILFSNINGLNHSVSASLAHSYVIDIYGAWNVRIENCNIMQGWGAMASHFSDTVCMENCTFNRWDGHYGVFGTNIIHNCNFVGLGMIRIGYGAGSVDIDGCTCSQNSADTALSNGFVSFRNDFPVYYQGTVYVRHLHSTSIRLFNLSDYALENPGTVGTFPSNVLKLICYNVDAGSAMNIFNQSAVSRNIDFYAYDCPRLRFVHPTTGITLRIYNSNVVRAEVGSNTMYIYGGTAGAIVTTGTIWASGVRIVGNVEAADAEFFGCHALSALTITAAVIKVENCGGTAQVALVGTATVHNSYKWGTGTVSGAVKVMTLTDTTSATGNLNLGKTVVDTTILAIYSRTAVNGEYCRFTPYSVDTTWYAHVETSAGPVSSESITAVVTYIDKT